MSSVAIPDLLLGQKSRIVEAMRSLMAQLPDSRYREFLTNTEEGRQRMVALTDILVDAVSGQPDAFLKDQESVGYRRAIEGVRLDHMCHVFHSFRETFYDMLKESLRDDEGVDLRLLDQWDVISKVLFEGYDVVARSYMRSREEQIKEKVAILEKLHNFAQQIVVTFESGAIAKLAAKEISSLFDMDAFVAIFSDHGMAGVYSHPNRDINVELVRLMTKSWKEACTFFVGEEGAITGDVDKLERKRMISVPIQAHGHAPGVLGLSSPAGSFVFTDKHLSLLLQFVDFTALALENASMVEEIEHSRQELRLLTDKVLDIREQERKRLAADIHDTVAQALTGIGYKIRFCTELGRRTPELVPIELEKLIGTVNTAVDQCRALISSLRPDMIDTLGIVPALRKLFQTYTDRTGIKVMARLPKALKLPPDVSICLYRVIQEGLTNIYKHADVRTANVKLTMRGGKIILTISDSGKGFDNTSFPARFSDSYKVGLLYSRERVESAGGTLAIVGRKNRGCTMKATIPVKIERKDVEHNKNNDS